MRTFKSFISEVKDSSGNLKNACWKGYTAVGMKEKNGRKVPNCVPVKEGFLDNLKAHFAPKPPTKQWHPDDGYTHVVHFKPKPGALFQNSYKMKVNGGTKEDHIAQFKKKFGNNSMDNFEYSHAEPIKKPVTLPAGTQLGEARQKVPPKYAMPSDTRVIKPRKNTKKRTTGSFNKFGNFTPGMREEVEKFKVGDKVSIHAPDDLDWHEREGELVSTSDDGHVVKLNGGAKLSVSKNQIKKIDEEVNNRITKIHVRGQNVVIHRYDAEAKGTYKKVIHHHSPAAAQQYARKLQKGSMSKPKLVIDEEVEQIDEITITNVTPPRGLPGKSSAEMGKEYRKAVKKWNSENPPGEYDPKAHMKKVLANLDNLKKEEVEQIDERGADSKGYYRSTESGAGLTRKGAKHFGIGTAVTTPPSKLKKGSKAWKRRKSFCARMSGMPGPMKDEKGRPTRKAASLRRWNCH